MTAVALPKPLEDAFQEMERRGAEASAKIDEAVKALDESGDEIVDFDDPSLVRHVDDLRRTSTRLKAITDPPPPPAPEAIDFDDTPVHTPAGIARERGLIRPPRKPTVR